MSRFTFSFAPLLAWPQVMSLRPVALPALLRRACARALFIALLALALSGPVLARGGLLPLQVETLQHYGDYTKDKTVYLNHVFEEVALSIGLALVLIWAFGFELALKLRGDPLPSNFRDPLDRLDGARLAVRALALGTKACKPAPELAFEAQLYDEIATRANALLSKARYALISNSVDKVVLSPEAEDLVARAAELSARLKRTQPEHLSAAEVGDRIRFGWGFINRVNRGWRRALARRKRLKITAIEQLNEMRWPAWSSIRGLQA